jgi:serine/threonine protein kinase
MGTGHGVRSLVLHRLQATLNSDPFFESKEIHALTPMPMQGYCNINYTLQTPYKTYHLREFKYQANRKREFKVQNRVHQLGFAPKAYYLTETYMLGEYVKGKHKHKLNLGMLRRLALLLHRLHKERIKEKPMQLASHFSKQTPKVKRALKRVKLKPKKWVLSHNDLNPNNILFEGLRIKLIDWEFASMNDCYFDLASLSIEFQLKPLQERHFLQSYFQTKPIDREKLEAYKVLYAELCKQWFEVRV